MFAYLNTLLAESPSFKWFQNADTEVIVRRNPPAGAANRQTCDKPREDLNWAAKRVRRPRPSLVDRRTPATAGGGLLCSAGSTGCL